MPSLLSANGWEYGIPDSSYLPPTWPPNHWHQSSLASSLAESEKMYQKILILTLAISTLDLDPDPALLPLGGAARGQDLARPWAIWARAHWPMGPLGPGSRPMPGPGSRPRPGPMGPLAQGPTGPRAHLAQGPTFYIFSIKYYIKLYMYILSNICYILFNIFYILYYIFICYVIRFIIFYCILYYILYILGLI